MRSTAGRWLALLVVLLLSFALGLVRSETSRAGQTYRLLFPVTFSQATKDASVQRQHYGVIINNRSDVAEAMKRLGIDWYLDYNYDVDSTPAGVKRALFIDLGVPLLSLDTLRYAVTKSPGSYWIIGGEPNVVETGNKTPKDYADILSYYTVIKTLDPSAHLLGPGVLNFDYTCEACGGFQSGRSWIDEFRLAYLQNHGSEPPFDAWTIDTYDLSWDSLPTVNSQVIIDQVVGLRRYLDSIPEQAGKPIWISEIGIQWGYDSYQFKDGKMYSDGPLRVDLMTRFMVNVFGWLDQHAEEYKIDKWFVYSSHIKTFNWAAVPSGIHFIDGTGPTSTLSAFGQVYHSMAQGLAVSP